MGHIRTEDFFRRFALLLAAAAGAFAIVYVLFLTTEVDEFGNGNWRTTNFGSAVHDPESFFKILLDALTFAGLLFIVASGFSLIFGLMRVMNMAHGSVYLLGGYIAYEIQQKMNPESQGFSISRSRPLPGSGWFPCSSPSAASRSSAWACSSSCGAGTRARTCGRSSSRSPSPSSSRQGDRVFSEDGARGGSEVRRQRGEHRVAGLERPEDRFQLFNIQ